jgi:hypothetical protein
MCVLIAAYYVCMYVCISMYMEIVFCFDVHVWVLGKPPRVTTLTAWKLYAAWVLLMGAWPLITDHHDSICWLVHGWPKKCFMIGCLCEMLLMLFCWKLLESFSKWCMITDLLSKLLDDPRKQCYIWQLVWLLDTDSYLMYFQREGTYKETCNYAAAITPHKCSNYWQMFVYL